MIPLKRVSLLAVFLFTCSLTGFAQKFCDVAPPSPYKHSALIVTDYDSTARKVKTTLEHPRAMGGGIYLYASFFQQDRRLRTGPVVEIVFISISKEKYRDSHNVRFVADGHDWPYMSATQYSTDTAEDGHRLEKTRLTLTRESLIDLLKARKVKARLGSTEFELSNNHLESLRELASLMGGPRRTSVAMR
jgi:hypothetical protein